MKSSEFSLTAVVNEFPAPSQTFIGRKLKGLADAGVDVRIGAARFSDSATREGFRCIPLVPWQEPRHLIDTANRRSLMSAARAVVPRRPGRFGSAPDHRSLPLRERLILGPLLAIDSDIIHFEFSGIAVTYRHALAQLGRTKVAVSCRGTAEKSVPLSNPERAPLLREVFHAADLIHCVSDDMRRTVEDLGAPKDRILVNRPAIPVSDFAEIAIHRRQDPDHQGLRVLSIGRLNWAKGFDDALKAIKTITKSSVPVEYRIAGEGPERAKLSFLIDFLGLRGTTELLGACTQEQIHELLTWADVLLLPSLSEGISNAVLEAMSAGLPVVATNCGGMGEVIDDGVDGFLVPPGDITALVDRLEHLGNTPDLRNALGEAAMKRAHDEFDISRQIDLFMDAYRRILPT